MPLLKTLELANGNNSGPHDKQLISSKCHMHMVSYILFRKNDLALFLFLLATYEHFPALEMRNITLLLCIRMRIKIYEDGQ